MLINSVVNTGKNYKMIGIRCMNGLLSMIGMPTELEYQMEDSPFRKPRIKFNTPKGYRYSDRQKRQPKVQH